MRARANTHTHTYTHTRTHARAHTQRNLLEAKLINVRSDVADHLLLTALGLVFRRGVTLCFSWWCNPVFYVVV